MRERFVATVSEAMDGDDRLAVVLAAISVAQFAPARRRHPDRVIDVGIREQAMVGVAGGLALAGMRPVVHTFPPFLVERAYEQVKLDLTHQGVGAVLVSSGGSYDMAAAGRTHQSHADVSLIDSIPGWSVHVPGHQEKVRALLHGALSALGDDRSVYIRLSARENASAHPAGETTVVRRGSRGVVLAVGPTLDATLRATRGLGVTVLYTATVRPFPAARLRAAVESAEGAAVALVEPYLAGTSAHCAGEALRDVPHRLLTLGTRRDEEVRLYGTPEDHDAAHGLDAEGLERSLTLFFRPG
ncbi:transketolase [Haloechinothrix sp. LS1_15]|nr:transketolase [Haloechinothrix sp. LS1_15]